MEAFTVLVMIQSEGVAQCQPSELLINLVIKQIWLLPCSNNWRWKYSEPNMPAYSSHMYQSFCPATEQRKV